MELGMRMEMEIGTAVAMDTEIDWRTKDWKCFGIWNVTGRENWNRHGKSTWNGLGNGDGHGNDTGNCTHVLEIGNAVAMDTAMH